MLAVVILYGGYRVLAVADQTAIDAARAEARASASAMRQKTLRLLDAVEAVHRLAILRSYHVRSGDASALLLTEDAIRQYIARNGFGIIQLAIIRPDGVLDWSSVSDWQPVDLSDREHFRAHADGQAVGLFVSVPVLGRATNRWSVQFTHALRNDDGSFAGVAVVSVDPGWIEGELDVSLREPSDVAALTRLPGEIVLARVPAAPGRVGRPSVIAPQIRASLEGDLAERSFMVSVPQDPATYATTVYEIVPRVLALHYAVNVTAVLEGRQMLRQVVWFTLGLVLLLVLLMMITVTSVSERNAERAKIRAVDETISRLPIAVYRSMLSPLGTSRLLYCSSNLARITGSADASRDLVLPRDWHTDIGRLSRQRLDTFIGDLRRQGWAEIEYPIATADGAARLIQESAWVLHEQPDGTLEVSGYLSDVSEIRGIERMATDAAKLASLGEMAAGVAHEMNQPLTTALLAAENADYDLTANKPDAVRRRLARIIESITRTTAITENLCRFARGEAQDPPTAVDVASALSGALLLTGSALRAEQVELKQDLSSNLPFVLARPIQLEQVFVNLFLNARDAFLTRPAEGRRIAISAGSDAHAVTITVRDNAGGIPAEVLGRIFEPFFTTKGLGKGTGLGLAISRRIIEEVGGSIAVANVDDGAVFTIRIPLSCAGLGRHAEARAER